MPVTSTHAGPRRCPRLRIAAAAALVVVLGSLALTQRHDRFEGSVVSANGAKVYVAREGQRVGLELVDRERARTPYRIFAFTGSATYALAGRTGERGAASRVMLPDVGPPSQVSVRWILDGRTTARWVFLVRPRKGAG